MTPGRPYKLAYSGEVQARLRSLLRRAAAAGVGDRVSAALLLIADRLAADPVEWGDPTGHLNHLNITVYHRLHDELSVAYGVHDDKPIVWLTGVEPVLTHPLCR